MFADESAAVFRRAGGKLREVALLRVRIRPQNLGDRESARPELPFKVVSPERVRCPVAALPPDDVRTPILVHAGERVELVDGSQPPG